jgi:serine/threonine protein kinase
LSSSPRLVSPFKFQYSVLGDGAYSEVYKVKRLSDGGIYALKKVKMGNLS